MDAIIIINNKNFRAKFGLGVFRLLGEKWNLPTLNAVINYIITEMQFDLENIPFNKIDIINDLIFTCINSNPENKEQITYYELDDLYFSQPQIIAETIGKIIGQLSKDLPKQTTPEPGKPKVVRKATK